MLTGLALVVIAGIIGLVSFFYLLSGYSRLRRVDREFDLPYYGLWLEVAATVIGTLAALGVFIAAFGTGDVGLPRSQFYIIAGIKGLVGYVLGYIIGPFRLDNRYKEGDFKVAGIPLYARHLYQVPRRGGRDLHVLRSKESPGEGRGLVKYGVRRRNLSQ